MSKNVRIEELIETVQQGRVMDAMNEFYAHDCHMEEPAYGATVGLPANLEREQKFVDSVKEFKSFEVKNLTISGDTAMYENVMEWVDVNGQEIRIEQVAVQEWKDGKIVRERFYYAS